MKKRKDGLYAAQIYLGSEPALNEDGSPALDKNGKPKVRRKYKTLYHQKQSELKKMVSELKLKMGKGIDISAADEPFSKWAERFIKSKEAEGVGFSHLANLKSFNGHLSGLHKTELSKLSAADIQAVIDALALHHDGKKPLSKRTLTGIKQFAGQVYKMAIGARVVDYNPADYVKIPKTASVMRREAITEEQQAWVRETPHRAQTAAMLMLYAGLRRGEATALTWGDIDFEGKTINVRRAAELAQGAARIKSTKTKAGARVVPMPAILVEHLRKKQKESTNLYVIHDVTGGMISKTVWRNMWSSYMKDLNVKYGYKGKANKIKPGGLKMKIDTFTPHQLRHTFASMLYMAGVDALAAKDIVGHKDVRTTLGIYTHLDGEHKKASAGKLDEYLSKYDASKNSKNKA